MTAQPLPGAYTITPVTGIGEIRGGDDLAALIGSAADLAAGDIVVVTSKIVSKAEGLVRSGADRDEVIDEETVRVVSQWSTPRGRTVIAQTRHGFVMAAAGVDASNVPGGSVVPLPPDPDGSARRLRAALRERHGVSVGVVLSDTAGRPWRDGVIDFAVGAAGIVVRDDYRGRTDSHGNDLGVTVVAVADELAAMTEPARAKLSGNPVAVVRGLGHFVTADDGPGVAALIRPAEEDRFALGTPEAQRELLHARRDAAGFTGAPVPDDVLDRAGGAAERDGVRFERVTGATARIRVLDAVAGAWAAELRESGAPEAEIAGRLAADEPMRDAPCLVLPCVRPGTDRFAAGLATQSYLLSLTADGHTTRLLRAPIVRPGDLATELGLADWTPVTAVAAGVPPIR